MSQQHPLPGAGRALALLIAINLLNYLDRYVLGALSLPIREEFSLPEEQFGLLFSVFIYAYMIGAPLLGSLSARYSRWWVIAGSVALWSLASAGTGLVAGFTLLLIMRILVGVGEAAYGPAAPALLSDYFPLERRGKIMAFFYIAIPVGSALGFVYGGFFVNHWRMAFWLLLIPGLLLAALCLTLRDPGRGAGADEAPRASLAATMKHLKGIPSYLANTGAMTAMTFLIGGISVWIAEYVTLRRLAELGLDKVLTLQGFVDGMVLPGYSPGFLQAVVQKTQILEQTTKQFGIVVVLAGIFSTLLGGLAGDWLRPKIRGAYLWVSGTAVLLAFPCLLLMLWLPFPWAWVAIFGAVFFLFFNTGPANTALANVVPSPMRATAFAINIFIIHALGDALSPPLLGWLARHHGWNTAFLVVSPLVLVASALWIIGARHLPADEARAESSR